jgi:hypothetical protein
MMAIHLILGVAWPLPGRMGASNGCREFQQKYEELLSLFLAATRQVCEDYRDRQKFRGDMSKT